MDRKRIRQPGAPAVVALLPWVAFGLHVTAGFGKNLPESFECCWKERNDPNALVGMPATAWYGPDKLEEPVELIGFAGTHTSDRHLSVASVGDGDSQLDSSQ